MKFPRTIIVILVLIGLAIFLIISRKPGLETLGRTVSGDSPENLSQSKRFLPAARSDLPISAPRSESKASKAGVRVIASEGKGVVLEVMNDGTFQLSLAESAGDIYVPVGKEFFQSTFSNSNPVPNGVFIKIRNGNGEILTASSNPEGWHSPAFYWSGGVFSSGNEQRELLRDDQRSAVFKLSAMLMMIQRNLKNQGDLEFKLSVRPFFHNTAWNAKGEPLAADAFPEYETDWLDGELLYAED